MNVASISKPACVAAALLLAGCMSMRVTSSQYPEADFSGYRSYAWISDDPLIRPSDTEPPVSALTARRIHEAIEAELAAKGYSAVAVPQLADFVVAYTVGTRDRIDAGSYPAPYRGPWLWRGYGPEMDLRVYQEGTLAIDIFDGDTRQPVWHGRASKEITGTDVADPQPVIRKAVTAILQKFPSR